MTLLKDQLESDVLPMMIVYACVGVILALVELITVVLASAYVAQINRRRRREEKTWRINVDDRVPMPRAFSLCRGPCRCNKLERLSLTLCFWLV
jgi:hypothetical protein